MKGTSGAPGGHRRLRTSLEAARGRLSSWQRASRRPHPVELLSGFAPPVPAGVKEAAHRVPARINDLTRRRSRADSRVAWVGGEPGARGAAGGPEGLGLPRRSEERRRSGNRGGARAALAGGRAVPGRAAPQQGGGSPGADSGPRRQRRLEESSCAAGDARVSG
ncbi:ADP-ribosylation factor 6 isoform X2 [Mirounga leonina]|uniref:ADP-ribosylation factor 6 isoform X2 n=1 Tax=Mirounga leonina TaxID=9715 RepID=UPI00156C320B|nr:ADP-ribosylation factor 6 isoform X2 [Mirounga leonina]